MKAMEETLTAVNCVLSTTLMIFMSLRAAFNSGREMMGKKKSAPKYISSQDAEQELSL